MLRLMCARSLANLTLRSSAPGGAAYGSLMAATCLEPVRPLTTSHRRPVGEEAPHHTTQETEGAQHTSVEEVKDAILDAALEHVLELGWSEAAMARGAEALNYSAMSHTLVEHGGGELFIHLQRRCNEELESVVEQWSEERRGVGEWSTEVERALRHRLLMIAPYSSVWHQGLASVSLSPALLGRSVSNLLTMADTVCYYAGDRSTDTQWYTSRARVVALYKASELYLLQDDSPHHQDTLSFLHRRVQDLNQLSLEGMAGDSMAVASAASKTLLNILGLNKHSR